MRIPDVGGLKNAHEALNTSNATVSADALLNNDTAANSTTNEPSHAVLAQPKSFGRASAVLHAANGSSRSTHAEKHHGSLNERQSSCPKGSAFYKCQNGFTGCCSVNPCNPRQTCPDGQSKGDESSTATSKAASGDATSSTASETVSDTKASQTDALSIAKSDNGKTTTGIRTASATGTLASTSSRKTPRPTASAAPNCPRANGKTYDDSFQIPYRIRCNSDNTYDSFDTVAVGTGGYDQCFSACSQSEKCAGFTYVGLDKGNCYLKADMPNNTYEAKRGGNYVSCAKLDPNQSAGHDPAASKPDKPKSSTGAIVGGVLGGVAFLALVLLCIALIAKRRRKKIETKRRGTVTHVFHGPTELDMTAPSSTQQDSMQQQFPYQQQSGYTYAPGYGPAAATHQRQGSTSHDVFSQPYGGNVYDPRTHTRQRSIYAAQQTWV